MKHREPWQMLAAIITEGVAALPKAERERFRRSHIDGEGRTCHPYPALLDRLRRDLPLALGLPPSGWTAEAYEQAGGTVGKVTP